MAAVLVNSLGAQLWGAAPGSSFGEQLWTAFQASFEAASRSVGVLGSIFATRLSVTTLKSCGQQLCGFAAALTSSCFEERRLWGVALESSFGEQLFGAALDDNNFGERLWGTALWNSFGKQEQL